MKKIFAILMLLMFAFPFVAAQEIEDFSLPSEEIVVNDIVYTEAIPDSDLGGIVSSVEYQLKKFLDFAGIEIYSSITTNPVDVYEFMLFPANSDVDFPNLFTELTPFASSNLIELRGASPHVYNTFSTSYVSYLPDFQALQPDLNIWVATSEGDLNIFFLGADATYKINGDDLTELHTEKFTCNGECPTALQLNALGLVEGVDYTSLSFIEIPEFNNLRVLILANSQQLTGFLYDLDNSGTWEFQEDIFGKTTSSFAGESLIFAEAPAVYDAYVIF